MRSDPRTHVPSLPRGAGRRRRTTRRRRPLSGGAVALALAVAACGGSDGAAEPAASDPGAAAGDAATTADPPVDDGTPTTADLPVDDGAPATDPGAASGASTTTITPSAGADLPSAAPGSEPEPAPVTTVAGPLPEPDVRLVDVATFAAPVEIATRPSDTRLYVVEQGGSIVAADDESNQVVFEIGSVDGPGFTTGGERGLLGLAFHPDEDLAYIDFTDGDGDTVVAELAIDPGSGRFDPASYREVLTVDQPYSNHNGGELAFGPDGLLYVGLGDGGDGGDPDRVALDLSSQLGKILRIDPLPDGDRPFGVPDDNPHVDDEGADPTIWSSGLRNPWRFSFDSLTGDLWIGDVGQGQVEEIDLAPATDGAGAGRGLSFGWSAFEGDQPFNDDVDDPDHTRPVVTYTHEGGNCSVSGGVVARESSFEQLNGWYVFGDFCSGTVWALDTTSVTSTPDGPSGEPRLVEVANVPALAAVVEGPLGDVYTVSTSGAVQRLAPA
ncbi:PQQ-dependent sugar dehydrogenase [Ilumatobacter sp.]|uniref:PQQ-dependent sugar dehydrogenase n=1 Tax=Ilumatobacter sp. TaxID=1967498 RepID=UPI003B52C20B